MIKGDRIKLRALERSDLPSVVRWMNDPEVTRHLLTAPIQGLEEMEQWYDAASVSDDGLLLIMDERDGPIGYCGTARLEWSERRCELWIIIGEQGAWGRGYGTDVVSTLLRYLFYELNMNRVQLIVDGENHRAIRMYEGCGFRREGINRGARFKDGHYRDDVIMAILRRDSGRWARVSK